jgi:predicted dienelactone hydrolase
VHGLLPALLLAGMATGAAPPLRAADTLLIRVGGLQVPLDLQQLEDWVRQPGSSRELGPWLNLVDPNTRRDLRLLLLQPLPLQGQTLSQLLDSWAGGQLLEQLGTLLRSSKPGESSLLYELLRKGGSPTVLALLKAIPTPSLDLDLDALAQLAVRLRQHLQRELQLQQQLAALELPAIAPEVSAPLPLAQQDLSLAVTHRRSELQLQLWWPRNGNFRSHWVLLSHGLGGASSQFAWLAEGLAAQGWPVLAVQHSGSDDQAVRGLLEGRRPLPGIETLPERLQDLEAVSAAINEGRLNFGGTPAPARFVLVGHSLGGLAGLVWAGAAVQPGLEGRCRDELRTIPLLQSSFLLQCQFNAAALPPLATPLQLDGMVLLNGFGSLLWAKRGLASVSQPVLMVGGSLDLITPPTPEQLLPFRQLSDSRSRLALVEGSSHFSPVRVDQSQPLMQLGSEFVGKEPRQVQEALLQLQIIYLRSLEAGRPPPVGLLSQAGVRTFVLDRAQLRRL